MQNEKRPQPPAEFREDAIAKMDAAALTALLKDPKASEFQKAKACQRAGELGAKEAVPALAALLDNEHLSVYARYGLEPIAGPEASAALRDALSKLKGDRLIGVVNSIAKRRDSMAVPAIAKLMAGSDLELAKAAASALGHIGGEPAARELQTAWKTSSGPLKAAVADAGLVLAERFLAAGQRSTAMMVYTELIAPEVPKPVRLAAMSAIVREETSVARPR